MAQIEFSGTVYFQASGPWVFRPLMIHFWFVGTVYFMRGAVYFRSLMTHLGFLGTVYFQREDRIFYAGGTVYFQHLRTLYFSRPYILSRGPYIFSPRTVYFQPPGPYIFSLDRIFYGWPSNWSIRTPRTANTCCSLSGGQCRTMRSQKYDISVSKSGLLQ